MDTKLSIQEFAALLVVFYIIRKVLIMIWQYQVKKYTIIYQVQQFLLLLWMCHVKGLSNRQKTTIKNLLKDPSKKAFKHIFKYKMLEIIKNSKTEYIKAK